MCEQSVAMLRASFLVLDTYKLWIDYPVRRPKCRLKPVLVLSSCRNEPDSDRRAENRMDHGSVEGSVAFFQTESMCVDHFRSLEIVVPKKLKASVMGTVLLRTVKG